MLRHTISFQLPSDFFEEPNTPQSEFKQMLESWFEEAVARDHDFKLEIETYKCRNCGSYRTIQLSPAEGFEFYTEYFCGDCKKYGSPDDRGV
jgi:predicted SprT family Zn-dependent metalloprotease